MDNTTKEIKGTKTLKSRLKEISRDISNEIGKRENLFAKRSEAWQESMAGNVFMERTEQLREVSDMLDECNVIMPSVKQTTNG